MLTRADEAVGTDVACADGGCGSEQWPEATLTPIQERGPLALSATEELLICYEFQHHRKVVGSGGEITGRKRSEHTAAGYG